MTDKVSKCRRVLQIEGRFSEIDERSSILEMNSTSSSKLILFSNVFSFESESSKRPSLGRMGKLESSTSESEAKNLLHRNGQGQRKSIGGRLLMRGMKEFRRG